MRFVRASSASGEPSKSAGPGRRSCRGAWRNWLIERCRKQAFTLRGLVAELAERGLEVDYRSVWEFVHAEGLSYKKRRWSRPSRIAPT